MSKLIFVTGTDTGVGKTVVTAALLNHLRQSGVRALAVKPFCSGGREDARHLLKFQAEEMTLEECNPYYFKAPLAPLIAARRERRRVKMSEVCSHIEALKKRCEVLLVEGAGGVLVPAGERYTMLDLIVELGCDVVVIVAANRLGTINHTLLTYQMIQAKLKHKTRVEIILNQTRIASDLSNQSNVKVLREWLPKVGVTEIPNMGRDPFTRGAFSRGEKKIKIILARIFDSAIFAARQTRRVKKTYETR